MSKMTISVPPAPKADAIYRASEAKPGVFYKTPSGRKVLCVGPVLAPSRMFIELDPVGEHVPVGFAWVSIEMPLTPLPSGTSVTFTQD